MKRKSIFWPLAAALLLFSSCNKDDQLIVDIENDYVVFASNDLGMHCLNPTYDELVILPPFNTVNVQVIKRGNPPEIVTEGLSVDYRLLNNTTSSNKREYGGFWTNFTALFGGTAPANDIGLTGTALSGIMEAKTDHFTAEGIPVVPVNDDGVWNPFQVIEVKVKDATGNLLATTQATVPTSDEINCAKCHTEGTNSVFTNILNLHDEDENTQLASQKPVLCATCHGSPALGTTGPGSSGKYFSEAIHDKHANKGAGCYDCHPGASTKCNRSLAHMNSNGDGNCIECHGTMKQVASSIEDEGRIPWVKEPECATCHSDVMGVETNNTLYRNAMGHGKLYCTTCHGSPHAMYPSHETTDNYQPNQYQGDKIKTIGSCGTCHRSSRGEEDDLDEFAEKHGGDNPKKLSNCHVCHTVVPDNTNNWPHSYTWTNSN